MGNITIKTNNIIMAVEFEAAVVHLSNSLHQLRATHGVSSIET